MAKKKKSLDEFIKAKRNLTDSITSLIVEFEEEFNCRISEVDAGRFQWKQVSFGGVSSQICERAVMPRVVVEF